MTSLRVRLLFGCLAAGWLGTAGPGRCADNLIFVPLPPCRVIDTRVAGAGGPLVAGTPRSFAFRGPNLNYQNPTPLPNQGGSTTGCGIPGLTTDGSSFQNIAKAVALNIVAVGPSGAGDVRAWAANHAMPTASVINYQAVAGLNLANGVIVPMCDEAAVTPCAGGDVTFRADVSGTHLVVDVMGYFHAGSTQATLSNTALGHQALSNNATGLRDTASGAFAMQVNSTGNENTASGYFALRYNNYGNWNTATGAFALQNNFNAIENTADGSHALQSNTSGMDNTAMGANALQANTTAANNTAIGWSALRYNTTGHENTALGDAALEFNTNGGGNTALGAHALYTNTGTGNTAQGNDALRVNTTGSSNTAVGLGALRNNTSGNDNVVLGYKAGYNLTNGSNNILIGSVEGATGLANAIQIGTPGVQDYTVIAGIRGETVGGDGVAVFIDSSGRLGTTVSSRRFKQDIEDIGPASDRILGLRPVKFRYKERVARGDDSVQFGLIAEEVAKVFPELVVYDKQGQTETVKYHLLVPLLLAELERDHQRLVQQDAELAEQRRLVEDLMRRVPGPVSPAAPR